MAKAAKPRAVMHLTAANIKGSLCGQPPQVIYAQYPKDATCIVCLEIAPSGWSSDQEVDV